MSALGSDSNNNNQSRTSPLKEQSLQQIGQIPFNLEYQDDLAQRIIEQFEYLNTNSALIGDHMQELLNDSTGGYSINTQIEQIQFKELQQSITALIEKVELNVYDKEETLLLAVMHDLERKFRNRPALPYKVALFRNFINQDNCITVKTNGIPYTGIENFIFILVLEKLMELRPAYKDTFGDRIEIVKAGNIYFKSISEEDVWFSHIEIIDEQTLSYHFLVLTFDVRNQLQPYLEIEEQSNQVQNQAQETAYQEPEPWYGTKRYDIVDHVLRMQEEQNKLASRSAVQEAALRAQQPFLTQSIKEISQNFSGPPKYLNQRDAPLEIPVEIIKNFFNAVDQDMDDRISIEELYQYAQIKYLPFDEDIVIEMFKEATSGRGIVHSKQAEAPLTLDEVCAAVRGRHRWNPHAKEWEVYYKPCRDYWIIFLQTVNERLFAIPLPKVVPTKIVAQFEEEELKKTTTFVRKEGVDKKYLSIREQKQSQFQKDMIKTEAGVIPEGTVRVLDKKQKKIEVTPYEQQINNRVNANQNLSNGFPTVTFESKEFFNQANLLSQVIPHWSSDKENPIYKYVPTSERPFTNDSDTLYNNQLTQKLMMQSMREQRLTDLQGKERTLQLAGTMALYNRKTSPWEVMKDRQGFVTKFKVQTILDQKMEAPKNANNQIDPQTGTLKPIQDPYQPPRDHKFRDLEIPRGQKDFTLRYKCPSAYNPYGMSEHDTRPKEVTEKLRKQDEKERERRKHEYESILKGKPLERKKTDWVQYHKLPDKLIPITQQFKDKHSRVQPEKKPFLEKEEFTPAYLQLARQLKDDVVFGKPNFNLYYKSLKPADLNEEFGGITKKPFKCIY